jgi:hypothetical protein
MEGTAVQCVLDEIDFGVDNEPLPQESDDGMPTTQQRFTGLEDRLDRIEGALALRPPDPPPLPLYRRLWRRVLEHKALSIVLCVFSVVAGGLFTHWLDHRNDGFNDAVDKRIGSALNAPGGIAQTLRDVNTTTQRTDATLQALKPFIQDIVTRQFENAAELSPQALVTTLPAVNNLLAIAKDQQVKVDPGLITKLGRELVAASGQHPAAWNAAIASIDYKSSISDVPGAIDKPDILENLKFHLHAPSGTKPPSIFYSVGTAPRESSALYNRLGIDENQSETTGAAYLVVGNGAVELDQVQLRHVVFRNVHVYYSGGPTQLDDVYFVNCTFSSLLTKNSTNFVLATLAPSPAVTFAASMPPS